jgi:hypothetical protein
LLAGLNDANSNVTVLICRRGAGRVGLVVLRVLEVSAGTLLAEDGEVPGRLAMVNGRVTTLWDEFAGIGCQLQEVA